MRTITIESFIDLQDAMLWMERALYDYFVHEEGVKGEIEFINGEWRVGVITTEAQGEFDFTDD